MCVFDPEDSYVVRVGWLRWLRCRCFEATGVMSLWLLPGLVTPHPPLYAIHVNLERELTFYFNSEHLDQLTSF
jgi:hypothetical protein